jgi:alkylation response protein AidB-like acyl-CoA dehydrogenase
MRTLSGKGWIAPNWPKEEGGPGWSATQKYIVQEEMALAAAPRIIPFGVQMVGPVLIAFGTPEQKQRYLPGILSSEEIWCQGYSEPGAGSDLASLQTRAVLDGDHYVVNGSKTWTSSAHMADRMFTLVRTSSEGKKQEGITVLLIDMKAPGVLSRPIDRFNGFREFNEVFLEDVRVPVGDRVGQAGEGWTIAKYLLGHERIGSAGIGLSTQRLARLKQIAAEERSHGASLMEDPSFSAKIARIEVDLMTLRMTTLRVLAQASADREVGPEASLLKIRGTEIQQDLHELMMETVGYYAHPYILQALNEGWNEEPVGPDYAAVLASLYFDWRKASIYAGSNEIQKNIISKAVLGL